MFEFTWFDAETGHWHIAYLPGNECEECIDWAESNQISYSYVRLN